MTDELADASVLAVADGAGKAIVTVDRAGTIIAVAAPLAALVGAPDDADLAGRSLIEWIAPDDQDAVGALLEAGSHPGDPAGDSRRLTATGRRDDGLPLVLDLHAAAVGVAPADAPIVLVVERAGGPVTWVDARQPPRPDRAGPDHVLSHDARAQIRNARNFLGLFSRKLPESGADPEKLPASFLDTSLRALATGDEILDRIVWFLRLEHDPITMAGVSLSTIIEAAQRQSQSDADEFAPIEGQEDLAAPLTLAVTITNDDNDRPDVTVVGNAELLTWVFAELLTNARKFARQPTTVTVDVTIDGAWIDIGVHNTGHRIDAALAPDAFGLGRMLQGRGDRPGVGMGLSLCRRIVLRHGGRVRVEPGADGTVARFRLLGADHERVR